MFELFIRCRLFSQSKRWEFMLDVEGIGKIALLLRALQLPEAQKQKECDQYNRSDCRYWLWLKLQDTWVHTDLMSIMSFYL